MQKLIRKAVFLIGLGLLVAACTVPPRSGTNNVSGSSKAPDNAGVTQSINFDPNDSVGKIIDQLGLIPFPAKPPAPDLELEDLSGTKVKLGSLQGKIVLLNFWATWCPPCRLEMPGMEKLYQSLKDNPDFVMIAISSQEAKPVVQKFIAENQYHFRILLDPSGQVSSQYSIQAIPTTYLIDRQGRVIAGKSGAHQWDNDTVLQAMRKLLALK